MGIRRRRRKLSSVMSRLDQRVKSVELRPVSLLTSDEVAAAVEIGQPSTGPATAVSANAPWQFRKIQDAYVYPKGVIGGTTDRVEIYLESDLGAVAGDRLEVSGIHWASSSAVDVDSDNFTVESVATPPWDNRASYMHDPTQDQLTGVTISHAYYFQPETAAPTSWTSRRRLQTRRKVDSYEISAAPNSTVTLTMNATHHFEVGDVIFVDIFAENSTAYGPDGLFYITAVTSTTIEYELSAGVDVAVPSTDVSTDEIYVFPVAREWAQLNSIWIDINTNQQYYWNGIRWAEYTPNSLEGDGDPPSAPTSLSASFEMGYGPNGGSVAVTQATLSWTAPTTSESGGALTDLLAYRIKYQLDPSGDWITLPDITDPSLTSYTFGDLFTFEKSTPSTTKTYNFRVYAIDSGNEVSAAAEASADTPEEPATNITTVKPVLSNDPPYLGTVTIYWNGTVKDALGTTQDNPEGMYYVEFHRSTSSTFTASESTLIGTVAAVANAKFVDGSLSSAYGTTFYYVAVIVDGNGTRSAQSDPPLAVTASSNVDVSAIQGIIDAANIVPNTIVTGQDIIGINVTGSLIRGNVINAGIIEANSITSDQINVGNLVGEIISSGVFTTRDNATSSGITIDNVGITAFNGSTPTFFVNAANGYVSIASGMSIGDVTAAYNAANTAQSTADSAASTASSAASTASSASTTANQAAADVGTLEGNVYYPGTTEIDGGNIRTGTVTANKIVSNSITSTQINTDYIYAGTINVDQINAGTIWGRSFVTASSTSTGQRVVMSSSTDNIRFYDSSNNLGGIIQSTGGAIHFGYSTGGTSVAGGRMYASSSGIYLSGNSGYAYLQVPASGTQVYAGPYLKVNNLGGSTLAYVYASLDGQLQRGGTYSSDERLKSDIADLTLGEGFINQLRPVSFTWSASPEDGTNFGVIAQEIQNTLASASISAPNGVVLETIESDDPDAPYLAVNYDQIVPILVKAVQEQSTKIASLEDRIATLESN